MRRKRASVWAEVPVVLHQPLPPDATIKWVYLVRTCVATHAEWRLQFVVAQAAGFVKADAAPAGTVAVETLDSNTRTAGSRWDYKLRPAPGGGSSVEVTVVRNPKGLKGRLLALGLAMTGSRLLRSQMERALAARA